MKNKGINKKKNINLKQFNFLDDLDISLQENKEESTNGISKRSESEQQTIEPLGKTNMESLDVESSNRNGTYDGTQANSTINDNREASGRREGDLATRYESSGDERINQHGFTFSNDKEWLFSTNKLDNETSKFIEQKISVSYIGFNKELNKEKLKPIIPPTPSIQKEVFFLNEEDASFNFLSKKLKAKNSIEAIKLAKSLKENNQNPTPEEQKTIAKYIGFGGVPQLFDDNNTEYQELTNELKSIVNYSEYKQSRESTSDSFYTNKMLIDGIYKAVDKLGYLNKKGLNILEPSCGSGNLIGYMPSKFRDNNKIVGIELNSISALISKQLYEKDNINILNQPFQEINHINDKFDVVIGNFPFGNQIIHDKFSSTASGKNLHNYFLTKSIESLSDKGILVAITSNQFLNQKNQSVKETIDKQSDFIGAIRLPKEAFKTADAEALCDIVIFQKNESKSIDYQYEENSWIKEDFVANFNVYNDDYFVARIGECSYEKDRFGKDFYNFSEPFENIAVKLNEIIENNIKDVSKDFVKKEIQQNNNIKSYPLDNNIFIGEYLVTKGDEIAERIEDSIDGSRIQILDIKGNKQKYVDYIQLKESTKELLRLEVENKEERVIFEQRKLTNTQYDDFVYKYGNLNDKNNKNLIIEDIRGRLVLELEQKTSDGKIKRAGILENRLIKNKTAELKNTKDALYHSVAFKGKVDLDYIASLKELNFNGSVEQAIKAIEGLNLAYYNPKFKQWELAEQYLSGNVLEKLEDLEDFIADDSVNFKRNKSALEKVIPKRVSIAEIGIDLSASWIPMSYKKDFIDGLLLSQEDMQREKSCLEKFEYEEVTATYDIKLNEWATVKVLNHSEYGIQSLPASEIITRMFKGRSIDVKERIEGSDNLIINQSETELALNKLDLIKEKFQEYVINNPSIAQNLEDKYNRTFNNYVVPNYSNGEQLTLPNSNDAIVLRSHQKRAVLRGILEDRYLLDHVVGSGKTYTMCSTIMERKRLGLNNKPMLVVPNHIVGQWRESFKSLYPNANVLCADEKNFSKDKRESFLSKMALNNWDCVIISHSAFEKISLNNEYVKTEIQKDIQSIEDILLSSDSRSFVTKQLKKVKEGYQSKLESMVSSENKDKILHFDNLGVDELYIDEAHEYKNLQFHTKQGGISGINPKGSNKAYDLYMKCQYIQEQNKIKTGKNNKGVFFATGTPISNSLAELYTISRYLDGDSLQNKNISHFDEWCNVFAEVKEEWQVASTGNGFEKKKMFSNFRNIPELSKMYLQYGDIVLQDEIKSYIKLPNIENGKPSNVVLNPTEEQKDFMNSIIERMVKIKTTNVDPTKDNHLKICSDARKASVDMRIVDEMLPSSNKVLEVSNNIVDIYNKWNEDKGTQLVFLDISTPKIDGEFSLYKDMKERLIAKGIKEEEIAFIHSYKKDEDKVNLFKRVNSGDIRVLLGSSQKMGAGMNVQERLVALHHRDAPWRPTDLEQREGRIIRQGNKLVEKYGDKFNVSINRYSTKYTYDTRLWQILENKAKFINEFKKGNIKTRSGEDIGNSEVKNVEEMQAIASGNPYLLLNMKLESEYRKKNNILYREISNRKLLTIEIKEYEEGNHKRYNYLKETIDNYNNLYANNSYNFKLENINDRFIMYEENTNIELFRDNEPPTELQINNRKEKFPSIIKEKIEELELEQIKITQDINLSKEMLKKNNKRS